jgi:hypothetical protein
MAAVSLVPGTLNASIQQGLYQVFTSAPIVNAAGAAINLSGWSALTAKLSPPQAVPYGTDVTFGTVTGSSLGVITLTVSATDLASIPSGTAKLLIEGINVALDPSQLIASGSLSLLNS